MTRSTRHYPIDKVIAALEIYRDNGADWVVVPVGEMKIDGSVFHENRNHDQAIDAHMADDLRKLSNTTAAFRQACVEFSRQRYAKYDPEDPDRFRRLRKQVIETGRDIRLLLGHIEPDIYR